MLDDINGVVYDLLFVWCGCDVGHVVADTAAVIYAGTESGGSRFSAMSVGFRTEFKIDLGCFVFCLTVGEEFRFLRKSSPVNS